ncbi:hypothetical protein ACQUWN_02490 [Rossellomorea aquimaris]|uniref:hypothetical protein n=1 Tax=Bacillaceae TaxID=186817 RepID=UPI001F05DA46|nr:MULTISPECIES: hypothetical protein [Bacillaceae]
MKNATQNNCRGCRVFSKDIMTGKQLMVRNLKELDHQMAGMNPVHAAAGRSTKSAARIREALQLLNIFL